MNAIYFTFIFCIFKKAFGGESISKECPTECTCGQGPMRTASFVKTWMTSWGEDDLPSLHPNDVLDVDMLGTSLTAKDANVDVNKVGLHVLCSLHPSGNLTNLLYSIPSSVMVLTLLQAPGCNFTILDGGQLKNFKALKALHLQGYAHQSKKQVSGYKPVRDFEIKRHQKLMEKDSTVEGHSVRLQFALAEDALLPLTELLLLDLQYVRLVASKDFRRARRYSTLPVDSEILLDMPIARFLKLAKRVDTFKPPPYVHEQYIVHKDKIENNLNNDISQVDVLHEFKKELMEEGVLNNAETVNRINENGSYKEDDIDLQDILPYDLYVSKVQLELAPFKTLNNLKYLRVAHAKLDRVGPELLKGLHNLHTLTLEYNKIQILPSTMFSPSPNLRHLSLAHNNLFSLDPACFEKLSQLLTLDLDYNSISVMGPDSFPPLYVLNTLRIIGNPITHLLPDAFRSINKTQHIFLGSEDVPMDIHTHAFRGLSSLETLHLENITRKTAEKSLLDGLESIKHLNIHGNVSAIEFDTFSGSPLLNRLDLSYCELNTLSVDAFFGLRSLRVLDLSHNMITNISPGMFDHLGKLRELYLNHNRLVTLPLGIFLPIPVKLIQLHENPWNCSCNLLQLKPAITNKIKKPRHVVCEWGEKLKPVCSKTKGKLVYDARVSPLCNEPSDLRGYDIYHATSRHLKCDKYHWDPKLLLKNSTQSDNFVSLKKKPKIISKESSTKTVSKGKGWLPLTAFTPEPIPAIDLLDIAEKEGLEEAAMKADVTETIPLPNSPQNDQPSFFSCLELKENNKITMFYNKKLFSQLNDKEKFKMKECMNEYEKQKEKQRLINNMQMKKRMKAIIREAQIRRHEKKILKSKMKHYYKKY